MPKPRIVRLAESWSPAPNDPFGEDKLRVIRYLLDNEVSASNQKSIGVILKETGLSDRYDREAFQWHILSPLRRDRRVFLGWSRGIFLVTTPEDADTALGSYTSRVRAELRHAASLRDLARRTKLMDGYQSKIPANKERATIYFDESGTPDVSDQSPAVFVVAAVVIESRQDLAELEQRFTNAFAAIHRPEDHELKTTGLSERKHTRVLRELSLLDYQWAAACFDKAKLESPGFANPGTFYRYAFQFLVGDLLTIAWQSDLVIDESSSDAFQCALESHLRRQNSGLPVGRLGSVSFSQSSKNRLVQLADLVAGAVRRSVEGKHGPLREIEHKMIKLQFWPPG
jgi:hypothetical protein